MYKRQGEQAAELKTIPGYDPARPVRGFIYDMEEFMRKNVENYLTRSKTTAKNLSAKAATPFLDESKFQLGCQISPADEAAFVARKRQKKAPADNKMNTDAASIIMQTMYPARLARPELLRAVGHLAQFLTKWTDRQDKQLHRLMSYIQRACTDKLIGFIGDQPADLELSLYSDADFAGDRDDLKSTSGGFLALTGTHSFFPLGFLSKKQSCQSHSTPEAELVACDACVRTLGFPALQLWEKLLGRSVRLRVFEDNEATLRIIQSGRFPTLRHVKKAHGLSIMTLHEWSENN